VNDQFPIRKVPLESMKAAVGEVKVGDRGQREYKKKRKRGEHRSANKERGNGKRKEVESINAIEERSKKKKGEE